MSVRAAQEQAARGDFNSALRLLWDALPIAQDLDDLETLQGIRDVARKIVAGGSVNQAAAARQMIDGILGLPDDGYSRPEPVDHHLPITTGNDLPGMRITEIIGPVFGMTVRSRDMFTQFGAKLKSGTVGGELVGMTEVMEQSRVQVLARMEERARALGADAVIAMRFDVSDMSGTWTEFAAYGTAVRAVSDLDMG